MARRVEAAISRRKFRHSLGTLLGPMQPMAAKTMHNCSPPCAPMRFRKLPWPASKLLTLSQAAAKATPLTTNHPNNTGCHGCKVSFECLWRISSASAIKPKIAALPKPPYNTKPSLNKIPPLIIRGPIKPEATTNRHKNTIPRHSSGGIGLSTRMS
jgi:hypothetical protein